MNKTCSKCKKILPYDQFYKRSDRKSGFTSHCKQCTNERIARYQTTEKYLTYDFNRRKTSSWRQYHNKYKRNYSKLPVQRQKVREYMKNKRRQDINFHLAYLLRSRLKNAIKQNHKRGSAVEDLGCSISTFRIYIEKLFTKGMSWDNSGKWHLDHIQPLCSFNLTNKKQFLKACHYTNYQPLWATENLSKASKDKLQKWEPNLK